MLNQAQAIYLFSSGLSVSGTYGYNVIVYDSLDIQYIKSCQVSENDCFILLSYTGETTRILQLARNLKLRHASTLSVGYICGLFFFGLRGCLMVKIKLRLIDTLETFNAIFDDRYESRLYQYYL